MIYTNQKNLMIGLKIEVEDKKVEVHQNPLSIFLR
jgi:hypothetical protein